MTSPERDWPSLKRAVEKALDLPAGAREAHLAAMLPDPEQRADATRWLEGCLKAAASPVLDTPAAEFAAPILTQVDGPGSLAWAITWQRAPRRTPVCPSSRWVDPVWRVRREM